MNSTTATAAPIIIPKTIPWKNQYVTILGLLFNWTVNAGLTPKSNRLGRESPIGENSQRAGLSGNFLHFWFFNLSFRQFFTKSKIQSVFHSLPALYKSRFLVAKVKTPYPGSQIKNRSCDRYPKKYFYQIFIAYKAIFLSCAFLYIYDIINHTSNKGGVIHGQRL